MRFKKQKTAPTENKQKGQTTRRKQTTGNVYKRYHAIILLQGGGM